VVRAGVGAALREYVFVEDAAGALLRLAADARARGNAPLRRTDGKLARVAFKVGSEHRLTAADVIAAVQRVLSDDFGVAGPPPEFVPADPALFEPGSQFSDLSKLRDLIPDYAPRVLEAGLRATIPWYLAHLRGQGA
jgi:nucleoside-diphosphate-sugar epimerase